jgi:hypothetical protein
MPSISRQRRIRFYLNAPCSSIWFGWIRPRNGEKTGPWLVIKSDDEFGDVGDPEIIGEEATSRLTGHANEELAAAGVVRKDHAARARVAKARKIVLPDITKLPGARMGLLWVFLEPSLALLCEKHPRDSRTGSATSSSCIAAGAGFNTPQLG